MIKKILLLAMLLLPHGVGAAPHYSLLDLAGMYVAEGKEKAALATFARAIALEPKNIRAYEARAFYLLKLNRTSEALADFSAVIALAPDYGTAYVSRGLVYSQLGDKKRADADFAMACTLGDSSGCTFAGGK
jgi:tetratricopeptide (TPR) repeat protein